MRTSVPGRAFIARFEGLRLEAHRDLTGIWTIGYGHTSAAGPPEVRPGLTLTLAEADAILARDLARFERGVMLALPSTIVPKAHEFDAMVSLAFNIGAGAFARSTLVRRFAAGDRAGAADAFLMWNKAGGRIIPGLARRRAAERRLFLTGRYADPMRSAALSAGGVVLLAGIAALLAILLF